MSLFKKKRQTSDTQLAQISGDSSVGEWLDHPTGGAIFRQMLHEAGQNETVLKPVHRLALKRLVAMSKGKFTEEMMNDMVRRANAGEMPTDTTSSASTVGLENSDKAPKPQLPQWQEKITPERFAGKTVIVTGAGSGIGRATASRVAREGGRVIAVDISKDRLEELKSSLPDAQLEVVDGDITKDDVVNKIVNTAGETIDALANVAGIMDNVTPLHEMTDDIWERVLSVNLAGTMKLSRAVLPKMLANNSGSIVNVGSEASLKASVAGTAYVTSKHAVVGLTKSCAFMYGPSGIRTNAVLPGAVMTNIEAKFESQLGSDRVNPTFSVMPDAATAEELAASITFLMSDDGVNVNGALLPSDGGWSVQ